MCGTCIKVQTVNSNKMSNQIYSCSVCQGYPKMQVMQTVQTMQTEYFFLKLDSLFSVLQLQNSVKHVVMFVIYPQVVQTRHLTVDSIDKRVSYTLYGKQPLLILNIIKSSIKLNFHISWVQIASIFYLVLHLLLTHICFWFWSH